MTTAVTVPAWMALALWLYLLTAHGRFWRADPRLPRETAAPPDGWPDLAVVVPARDEAEVLPLTLPALLSQDYPGRITVVLVDDASTDGTGALAEKLGAAPDTRALAVVHGDGPPPGWAGKVAAMARGLRHLDHGSGSGSAGDTAHAPVHAPVPGFGSDTGAAASLPRYVLFTDADIAHPADSVRRLVAHAEHGRLDLVSLMARLNTATAWERAIVPAFVYSFFQLYPPARANRPGSRTAAAAGGCMLVRRDTLNRAGGLEAIAAARIDDVALAALIKRAGGRTWLGVTTEVRSVRPYPRLADLWDMIARSAYTQLRHSPALLAGTVLGLLFMYALPPVFGIAFLFSAHTAIRVAVPALVAWAVMAASYVPMLRLYRLGAWRALLLPGVMMLYGAMTVDSARRHRRGRGGAWKGRTA